VERRERRVVGGVEVRIDALCDQAAVPQVAVDVLGEGRLGRNQEETRQEGHPEHDPEWLDARRSHGSGNVLGGASRRTRHHPRGREVGGVRERPETQKGPRADPQVAERRYRGGRGEHQEPEESERDVSIHGERGAAGAT